MPIYEYVCSACGKHADILHGINDPDPAACPFCGAEGTMRKHFSAPSVVFKGSGWAKKDRGGGAAKAAHKPSDAKTDAKTDAPAATAPDSGAQKAAPAKPPSSGAED